MGHLVSWILFQTRSGRRWHSRSREPVHSFTYIDQKLNLRSANGSRFCEIKIFIFLENDIDLDGLLSVD